MIDYAEAYKLKQKGKTYSELSKTYGISAKTIESGVNRYKLRLAVGVKEEPKSLLELLKKPIDINTLSIKLKQSERVIRAEIEDLKDNGYNILEDNGKIKLCLDIIHEENIHKVDWQGNKVIRFGVVSDTHMCSKWQQLTHLNTMYDTFEEEGIGTIYHSGDITEGVNMRQGHEYEVFKHGVDEQSQYVVENYPQRKNVVTKFITGNHDHSGIKSAGVDIGTLIAKERKDMIYLGKANAKIKLTPNCVLELNHPLDGASYALSYTIQKLIDSLSGGEKPNVLINGHHHKQLELFYRNIHGFEAATFQAQTPWMKGKRLSASIGGYIIELRVDEEGTIQRCTNTFIPFYKAVENDY